MPAPEDRSAHPPLGLRENWRQFALLVLVNAFVGAMVGLERSILPLLGEREFAIGDVAHPSWRGSAIGVYRLWRDMGYAVGALLAGVVADVFGMGTAIGVVAALTAASGGLVALRMPETLHTRPVPPSLPGRRLP